MVSCTHPPGASCYSISRLLPFGLLFVVKVPWRFVHLFPEYTGYVYVIPISFHFVPCQNVRFALDTLVRLIFFIIHMSILSGIIFLCNYWRWRYLPYSWNFRCDSCNCLGPVKVWSKFRLPGTCVLNYYRNHYCMRIFFFFITNIWSPTTVHPDIPPE